MKYISILNEASREAIIEFAHQNNVAASIAQNHKPPQEDHLLINEQPAIFVVSDGVTLNFKKLFSENKAYPNPSPAGEVAMIFCKEVIGNAKKKYKNFSDKDTINVFSVANEEVRRYNAKHGKNNISGNKTGFYAATGSFIIIKGTKAYWLSICDAFVAHFDKNMRLKFMSSGNCTPYAVINGEKRMSQYVEHGCFDVTTGDRLFVFTDGFEHYIRNSEFLNILKNWDNRTKKRINDFSIKMNKKHPSKFGHERSLIAILI